MSQQDHVQIVTEIYDAVGRGDVDAILERVSDGNVIRFRGSEDSALTAQAFAR